MRDGQIERLLGGYATNTLTESERQALFEAALDDQELFDALQDEQALRELLEDSGSRSIIERAAKEPQREPVRGWFSRPAWAWGLAGCVAAAGALAFWLGPFGPTSGMNREVAVLRSPPLVQSAAPPADSGNVAPAPKAVEQRAVSVSGQARKKESAPELVRRELAQSSVPGQISSSSGAARPAVTSPPTPQAAPQTALGGSDQVQVATLDNLRRIAPGAGFRASTVAAPMTGDIPYSVVRRGPNDSYAPLPQGEALQSGDAVRVVTRPPISGTLSVYKQSAAGDWNIIQTLPVTASAEYTVPRAAIEVNAETRLRLVMTPGETTGPTELREAAKEALNQPKQRLAAARAPASPLAAARTPQRTLVTNITLAPGQAVSQ